MEKGIGDGIYNIGSGLELTIGELAGTVAKIVGFKGQLLFDVRKPDGTPRKLLDVSKMKDLGWEACTSLSDGIERSYMAYQRTC